MTGGQITIREMEKEERKEGNQRRKEERKRAHDKDKTKNNKTQQ